MKFEKWHPLVVVILSGALAMPIATIAQHNLSESHPPKHHVYRLIEGVNLVMPEFSHFLNNHRTIVGGANTTTLNPYGCVNPFNNIFDCFVQRGAEWHDGTLTDLSDVFHHPYVGAGSSRACQRSVKDLRSCNSATIGFLDYYLLPT